MIPRSVCSSILLAGLAILASCSNQQNGSNNYGFTTALQCKCSDLEQCSAELTAKTNACKTNAQCMSFLTKIGDSQKIEACLEQDHQIMLKLENCAKAKLNGELGCTNSPNPQNLTIPLIPVVEVPQMDGETSDPALQQQNQTQGPPELNLYLRCVDECSMADMEIIPGRRKKRSPVNCAFKLKCALSPPTPEIQQAYATCEKELSIDPAARMATSCNCLKSAGVQSLQC
ncbi:unnamed protein product [Auanema sp. JU1783]|nr:unnamed protein product [Auanema sp. JU1783]